MDRQQAEQEVSVAILGSGRGGCDLTFSIALHSETIDVRSIPVGQTSLLRNDKGTEIIPWRWIESRGQSARHLEGVLLFPERSPAGNRLMGHLLGEHLPGETPPRHIEMVLKELSGGLDVVLRWDLSKESETQEGPESSR